MIIVMVAITTQLYESISMVIHESGERTAFMERVDLSNSVVPELHDAVMKKARRSTVARSLGKLIGRGRSIVATTSPGAASIIPPETQRVRSWTTPLLESQRGADGLATGWKVRVVYVQDPFKKGDSVRRWAEEGIERFRHIDLLRVVEHEGQQVDAELAFQLSQDKSGVSVLAKLDKTSDQMGYVFPGLVGAPGENLWEIGVDTATRLVDQVKAV